REPAARHARRAAPPRGVHRVAEHRRVAPRDEPPDQRVRPGAAAGDRPLGRPGRRPGRPLRPLTERTTMTDSRSSRRRLSRVRAGTRAPRERGPRIPRHAGWALVAVLAGCAALDDEGESGARAVDPDLSEA